MYIKLQCNRCKNTYSIPLDKEINIEKCPCCGVRVSSADDSRMLAITEPFVNNVPRLQGVSILEISSDTQNIGVNKQKTNDMFSNAMDCIESIYNESSYEIQRLLASVIDTMYLIINGDVKKGSIEQLSETCASVRKVWSDKVDVKYEKVEKILFSENQ